MFRQGIKEPPLSRLSDSQPVSLAYAQSDPQGVFLCPEKEKVRSE